MARLFIFFFALISKFGYSQEASIVSWKLLQPGPSGVEAKANSTLETGLVLSVQNGWYIYAPTGNNESQGMIETKVIYTLPKGFSRAAKIQYPEPMLKNGHEVLEGTEIVVRQPVKIAADVRAGSYDIKGKLTWQTCNNDICLPPVTEEFIIKVIVK